MAYVQTKLIASSKLLYEGVSSPIANIWIDGNGARQSQESSNDRHEILLTHGIIHRTGKIVGVDEEPHVQNVQYVRMRLTQYNHLFR